MLQPIHLRTAEEMYRYSCEHEFGTGFGLRWGLRNFKLLEQRMEKGESAFLTFVGLHRFHSMSSHQRNFAYAITDRRILMGQVRSFWRIRFQSVPLNTIMNISFDSDDAIGVMKIMTSGDALTIGMSQKQALALSKELTELLPLIQELARKMSGLPDQEGTESRDEEAMATGSEDAGEASAAEAETAAPSEESVTASGETAAEDAGQAPSETDQP